MRAQVVLTPSESKMLLSKAIARMEVVRHALSKGTVVIHPSSTTYFLVQEITGNEPRTEHWVLGAVLAQGLCRAAGKEGRHYKLGAHLDKVKNMKQLVSDFPFKLITSYEMMHSAKPNPRYFKEIIEHIDRSPGECIMVGNDWNNDIVPAMKADLQVFWVDSTADAMKDLDPSVRGTLAEFKERFPGLRGS